MDDKNWVDNFIQTIESVYNSGGVIKYTLDGQVHSIKVSQELYKVIIENKASLIRIGLEAFKNFLSLKANKQDFEALVVLYDRLSSAELLSEFRQDSIELSEIATKIQEDKVFWNKFMLAVGQKLAFAALGSLL